MLAGGLIINPRRVRTFGSQDLFLILWYNIVVEKKKEPCGSMVPGIVSRLKGR